MGFGDSIGTPTGPTANDDTELRELLGRLTDTQRARLGTLDGIARQAPSEDVRQGALDEQQRILAQLTGEVDRGTQIPDGDGGFLATAGGFLENVFAPIIAPISGPAAFIGEVTDVIAGDNRNDGTGRTSDGEFNFGTFAKAANPIPFIGPRDYQGYGELAQQLIGDQGNERLFRVPLLGFDVTANRLIGFTGDVLLDPLTYVAGAGLLTDAASTAGRQARRAAGVTLNVAADGTSPAAIAARKAGAGKLNRFISKNQRFERVLSNPENLSEAVVADVAVQIALRNGKQLDSDVLLKGFGIDDRRTLGFGNRLVRSIPGTERLYFRNLVPGDRSLPEIFLSARNPFTGNRFNDGIVRTFGNPNNKRIFDQALAAKQRGTPEAFTEFLAQQKGNTGRISQRGNKAANVRKLRIKFVDAFDALDNNKRTTRQTREAIIEKGEDFIDAVEDPDIRSFTTTNGKTIDLDNIKGLFDEIQFQLIALGYDMQEITNYFPRFRNDLELGKGVINGTIETLNASTLQARRLVPGRYYLGTKLEFGTIAEIRSIAEEFNVIFDFFDTNPIRIIDAYIDQVSQLISAADEVGKVAADGFGIGQRANQEVFTLTNRASQAKLADVLRQVPEKFRDAVAVIGSISYRDAKRSPDNWKAEVQKVQAINDKDFADGLIDAETHAFFDVALGHANAYETLAPIVGDDTLDLMLRMSIIDDEMSVLRDQLQVRQDEILTLMQQKKDAQIQQLKLIREGDEAIEEINVLIRGNEHRVGRITEDLSKGRNSRNKGNAAENNKIARERDRLNAETKKLRIEISKLRDKQRKQAELPGFSLNRTTELSNERIRAGRERPELVQEALFADEAGNINRGDALRRLTARLDDEVAEEFSLQSGIERAQQIGRRGQTPEDRQRLLEADMSQLQARLDDVVAELDGAKSAFDGRDELSQELQRLVDRDLFNNQLVGRSQQMADFALTRSVDAMQIGMIRKYTGIKSSVDEDFLKFSERLKTDPRSERKIRAILLDDANHHLHEPLLTSRALVEGLSALARWDMGSMASYVNLYNRLMKSMAIATPGFTVRNGYSGYFGAEFMAGHTISDARWFLKRLRQYRRDPSKMTEDDRFIFDTMEARGDVLELRRDGGTLLNAGARENAEVLFDVNPFEGQGTRIGDDLGVNALAANTPFGRTVDRAARNVGRYGRALDERVGQVGLKVLTLGGGTGGPIPMETFLRGSHIATRMRRGNSYEEARESMFSFHFDYQDLGVAEQKARTLIPFYTYLARNTPLQVQLLYRRPGLYNNLLFYQQELKEREADLLEPEYFNQFLALPFTEQDRDGSGTLYFTPDLQINDVIQRVVDIKEDGLMFPVKLLLTDGTPILKTPIELYFNESGFTGNEISPDYRPNSALFLPRVPDAVPLIGGAQTDTQLLRLFGATEAGADAIGLDSVYDFVARSLGSSWAQVGDDGRIYVNSRVNYGLANTIPILGQLRRLLPSDEYYQSRGMAAWLSWLGAFTRTVEQADRNSEAYRRLEGERRVLSALEQAGQILGD